MKLITLEEGSVTLKIAETPQQDGLNTEGGLFKLQKKIGETY